MAKHGRTRSRLHVQWGPGYQRDKKLCVTNPVSDAALEDIAAAIFSFLEATMPAPGRRRTTSPRSHTTTVRFVLGKHQTDLAVEPLSVSLEDLQQGRTATLFERIKLARDAACTQLELPIRPPVAAE